MIKFFERFVIFLIIYILSELDFEDLSKVIVFGLVGYVLSSIGIGESGIKENGMLGRVMFMFVRLFVMFVRLFVMFVRLFIMFKRDDVLVRMMLLLLVFLFKVVILNSNFLCFC